MQGFQPHGRRRAGRFGQQLVLTPAFGHGKERAKEGGRPKQRGEHRCVGVFTHLLHHAVDVVVNPCAFGENVQSGKQRQAAQHHAADRVGQHHAKAEDGQDQAGGDHEAGAPLWIFKRLDDVVVGALDALGLLDDDLLDVLDLDPRLNQGKHGLVFGAVGHDNAAVGLEGVDHLIELGRDGAVGALPDLFVTREDGDFDFVLCAFGFEEAVVLRQGAQNGVGVALFRVRHPEFEGRGQHVPSVDHGTANGRLVTEVIVAVNGQHEDAVHGRL